MAVPQRLGSEDQRESGRLCYVEGGSWGSPGGPPNSTGQRWPGGRASVATGGPPRLPDMVGPGAATLKAVVGGVPAGRLKALDSGGRASVVGLGLGLDSEPEMAKGG